MLKYTVLALLLAQTVMTGGNRRIFAGSSAPTYTGNGCAASYSATGDTTLSCMITGVTAGQTLVIGGANLAAGSIAITDSAGTPVLLPGYPVAWRSGAPVVVYKELSATAGTHLLTMTITGTGLDINMIGVVASGGDVDAASNNFASSGTSVTGGSITTSNANDLIFSFATLYSSTQTVTPNSSPISLTAASQAPSHSQYRAADGTVTSPSTTNTAWTASSSVPWSVDTVALH